MHKTTLLPVALAMQSAFGVLGQVAMQELMTNPRMGAGFAELKNFVDEQQIADLGTVDPGE